MIEDMNVRKFGEKTQNDYIRHVKSFSTFLGWSPAKASRGTYAAIRCIKAVPVSNRAPSTARSLLCGSSSG